MENTTPEALPGPLAQLLSSIVIVGLRDGSTSLVDMIESFEQEMQQHPDVTAALEAGGAPETDELEEAVLPATEEQIHEVLATLARVSTTDPTWQYELSRSPNSEAARLLIAELELIGDRP